MVSIQLRLFSTETHQCSYFAERQAITHYADPKVPFDARLYQVLLNRGFRRSGEHIYRPHCPSCRDCVSLRVPVEEWRSRRNQRRAWNQVAEQLRVYPLPPRFNAAHYELFCNYIDSRHGNGDMANSSPDAYMRFLSAHWCSSRFVELRLGKNLLAVAVTDILPLGLSAVYTFFDPALDHLSPGVVSILWQIQECRRLKLPYLYLGYWIADCRKMAYKNQYRPFEAYINGVWERRGC